MADRLFRRTGRASRDLEYDLSNSWKISAGRSGCGFSLLARSFCRLARQDKLSRSGNWNHRCFYPHIHRHPYSGWMGR